MPHRRPDRPPDPVPDPGPEGPCVVIHRYRSSVGRDVDDRIFRTGESFSVRCGAPGAGLAPTRADGFGSIEAAARATGALNIRVSRPDSADSFESDYFTREELVALIVSVQSRDVASPWIRRFEVENDPYVCSARFECFRGTLDPFAEFIGHEGQVTYTRPWQESIVRTPTDEYLIEAYSEHALSRKLLRLTARQVREWLERVSLDRPDCHALRKDGLMAYARRMKDDALLSALRMSLAEFEHLPAETSTASGWRPEIVAITDFEHDREGGDWAEWFDMTTVLVVADVRVAAERAGAQAAIDAAPVREEKPFQALLSPHREDQRMWRARLLRRGLEPEVCVVTLEPEVHDQAMALLAKGEAEASEDDDGEPEIML